MDDHPLTCESPYTDVIGFVGVPFDRVTGKTAIQSICLLGKS
jgi:hypothetical protein